MKILIIDDDHPIVSLWSIALEKDGYQVVSAFSGKDGLEKAKTEAPQMILLDQIMPDFKGNDLLRMLKNDPATRDIPVSIVSNYSDDKMMHDALDGGAVDYILKYQIAPTDLVTKIKAVLPNN